MNYVDWTSNNWTCLQLTYIFEKISLVQLANNIPGHFCLRNFMYRCLQQTVQCAIDSWKAVLSFLCFFLLVSMNQVGCEAAKTGNSLVYGIGKILWWKIRMHMMKYQHTCAGTPAYEFPKVIDSILIKIFWNMQFESKRLVVRAPLYHPKQPTHEPFRFSWHIIGSVP